MKYSWPVLLCLACALPAQAQADTNAITRVISVNDAIQLALEHGIEIQLERFNVNIARFTLDGSYSYYDPAFKFSGQQNFNSSPGGFNSALNLTTPPQETWTENFSSGVGGYTATGMRYDFSANLIRSSGAFPEFDAALGTFVIRDRPFSYRTDVGVTFTQPLLRNAWIDGPRMQIKINKRQLKISELSLENVIMDVVSRVQTAYFDLVAARENVRVQEKALELATQTASEIKRKVEIGTEVALSEAQANSQAATAKADLISAQNDVILKQNVLKNLFTQDYSQWHRVTLVPAETLLAMPESYSLAESWANGLKYRPDYNQLKQQLEQQNINLQFRHNQLFPELDLFGTVGRNGLAGTLGDSVERIRAGDNPRWGGGGVLTVPFTFKAERNAYKSAKELQKQAVLKLKQLEQKIVVDIDDAVKTAQSGFERIDVTRQARRYAEQALEAEQIKLANGKSTYRDVLKAQKDLTDAQSKEISALTDYNKALSDFYFKEGTTLQRNKISVQFK